MSASTSTMCCPFQPTRRGATPMLPNHPPPLLSCRPTADTSRVTSSSPSGSGFYDTGLDQQLRRRRVRTILLGGIATNIGVESTARAAFDMGYELIFVEDAMSSISAEAHQFAVKHIFPRMGRVRSTQEVVAELA